MIKKYRSSLAVVILGLMTTNIAKASTPYIDLIGPSFHTVKADIDGRVYNNATYGVGLGVTMGQYSSIEIGIYRNSFYKASIYTEFDYTPIRFGRLNFGGGVGLVSGYQKFSGGGYLIPMGGAVVDYDIKAGDKVRLRIIPLWNAPSLKQATGFGALFNISYLHRF